MANEGWLSAAEATARLGVKPQTLYAYVSRGLIRRERLPGTRTSRYSRSDVERLAGHSRARPARSGPEIVVDPAITALDPAGHLVVPRVGRHPRRGRRPLRAGRRMVVGHHRRAQRPLVGRRRRARAPPAACRRRSRRDAPPRPAPRRRRRAAARRSAPQRPSPSPSVAARSGTLLATVVESLPLVGRAATIPATTGSLARGCGPASHRSSRRRGAVARARPRPRRSWPTTSSRRRRWRCGSPRRRGPTRTSSSSPGWPTAGGPLHGGASESVRTLLRDAVATDAEHAVGRALRDDQLVPGFGHAVYEGPDPRAPVLLDAIDQARPPRELCARHRVCST